MMRGPSLKTRRPAVSIQLLVLFLLLLFPPAAEVHAKGGGGHGGGGMRGRNRGPPLYTRHVEITKNIPWGIWMKDRIHPLGWHNVPHMKEVVSVLVNYANRTYMDGIVTSVSEETGEFTVSLEYPINKDARHDDNDDEEEKEKDGDDAANTSVAKEKEDSNDDDDRDSHHTKNKEVTTTTLQFHLQGASNLGGWMFLVLCCFCLWFHNHNLRSHDRQAGIFDDAFSKELKLMATTNTGNNKTSTIHNHHHHPVSGSYLGFTLESDNTFENQRVDVDLNFEGSEGVVGIITGNGTDSRDGKYTLKGHYSTTRVKWVETYDRSNGDVRLCGPIGRHEGMTVTVRGTYTKGRRFECFFRSSRGITGSVTLSLKKNVVVKDSPTLLPDEDLVCRRRKL